VVAILAFMASVALASNLVVARAVSAWTGDLQGTVTVQVRGADAGSIARRAEAAAEAMRVVPGATGVRLLSRGETEALLEPWLGEGGLPDDVPVPALVTAEVSPSLRADLAPLREAVEAAAPGAALDDHGAFNDRLVAAAGRLKALAATVFIMVMLAAAAIIVFAARAGLAANRSIIEVMHLVGATDGFVANEVQRRYLLLGLRGGLAGAGAAALVLVLAASVGRAADGSFLPQLTAEPASLAWLLTVPLTLCLIAAVTARVTVLSSLRRGFAPE
jgi:cell division transport system permease protein